MKIQCAFCKHVCCNPEWDEMIDCELALEETGKIKCCDVSFYQFELETNEKTCKSYLNAYNREYGRLNDDRETAETYKLDSE